MMIAGQVVELKFNFRALITANKQLSTVDEQSKELLHNGASTLFLRLKAGEPEALVDAIKLTSGFKGGDKAIYEAIEQSGEVNEGYEQLFSDVIREFEGSAFFGKEALKLRTNLAKTAQRLEAKEQPNQAERQQREEVAAALEMLS